MSGRPRLQIAAILQALDDRGVQYVVIGGVAGRAHGDPTVTYDLDITPAASRENLARLAGALHEMRVGLRVPDLDEPIAFEFDAPSIARFTTLATRGPYGDLDVVLRPDGIPGGYEQLAANAVRDEAYGLTIAIAGLDDLIASRHAAAAITGLERYTEAAQRLAALQVRKGGRAPNRALDEARAVRDASFPDPPNPDVSPGPAPDARAPRPGPESRGSAPER